MIGRLDIPGRRPSRRTLARLAWIVPAAIFSLGGAHGAAGSEAPPAPPVVVDPAGPATGLSAEQIVEKNVAARGGLDAWRRIKTMGWMGHVESPGSAVPTMPFVLEQERPNKTHFEINSMGQRSMRVFDGLHGWRVRPGANGGAADVQPFTRDELRFARGAQGIDGPVIDFAAKGNRIYLAGVEDVEGHKNYRIGVALPSGEQNDVWIDAQTFLDTKYERSTYSEKGVPGRVTVSYRAYKAIEGVQIPTILEIGTGSARAPDKMIIEKVAINPPINEKEFARPGGMRHNRMATVDIKPEDVFPEMRAVPNPPQSPAAK